MAEAVSLVLIVMTVVFVVLVLLWGVVSLFSRLVRFMEKALGERKEGKS